MILSPQPHVSAPPSLAEVLRAAEEGAGLIGRLEVVDATPTDPVPEDLVENADEVVDDLREALDSYQTEEVEASAPDEVVDEPEPQSAAEFARARSTYIAKSLDEIVPSLLAEIAELERCVRRTADEADRAARHLENARRMVAKVIKAADASQGGSVVRLAVPGQRAAAEAADVADVLIDDEDGPTSSHGRW